MRVDTWVWKAAEVIFKAKIGRNRCARAIAGRSLEAVD